MDFSLFKKVIDENKDYMSLVWLSNFGEPLLHPMILEFIRYCKESGVHCGIFTNGSLLDEDVSRKLLKSRIDKVIVSLDSINPKTYQWIKGVSKFQHVMKNLRRLIGLMEAGEMVSPEIIVQIIPMRVNEKEIKDFCKFWLEQGVHVNIHAFRTWGGQLKDGSELSRQQYMIGYGRKKRLPCGELWRHLVVLWDGTVVPCCCDYNGILSLGNVNDSTLSEIWNGEKMRELRRLHREGKWDKIPLCRDCTDWYGFRILDKDLLYKILYYLSSYIFERKRIKPSITFE